MAIKLQQKIETPKNGDFEKSKRFEVPGEYLCEVLSARFQPEDERYGDRYFVDLRVISGPSLVGEPTYWAKFKSSRYKDIKYTAKNGKTAVFTAAQQENGDDKAIQLAFAAVVGLNANEAGELAPGGSKAGEFERCYEEGNDSNVRGNRVIVVVDPPNHKGYIDARLKPASAARKAAPPAPPPSNGTRKPISGFKAAYEAAGFVHRDDAPGWFWNERTEEQLDESDLKAKLGF